MVQRSLIAALLLSAMACTHSDPQPPPDPQKHQDSPRILIRDVPHGVLQSPTPQPRACYVRFERCMRPDESPVIPGVLGVDRCNENAEPQRLAGTVATSL